MIDKLEVACMRLRKQVRTTECVLLHATLFIFYQNVPANAIEKLDTFNSE